MCAVPVSTLVLKDKKARQALFDASIILTQSLGAFTVLNYEELLVEAVGKASNRQQIH